MDAARPDWADHREHVRALVDAALGAADPRACLRRHLAAVPPAGPLRLVAAGKAALEMALALRESVVDRLRAGAVAAVPERLALIDRADLPFTLHPADHPYPTERNLVAAEAIAAIARATRPDESLIALVSGGGSAHLTLPAGRVTLEDIRAVSRALMLAGATIHHLNTVRKHVERLKGGRLAALVPSSPVHALILSDVIGGRLDVIASGPTAPDPTTYADALAVLDRYGVRDVAPALTRHLEAGARGEHPETPKPGDPLFERVSNTIIGSNRLALEAAAAKARALGFEVEMRAGLEGEAARIGRDLAAEARTIAQRPRRARAILVGGEATVTVSAAAGRDADGLAPSSRGGPCQELALAGALELDGVPGVALAAFATDGVDGPTDLAGAIVTGQTVAAARDAGLDPRRHLRSHDTSPLLERLGAAIRTGPTGTNVNQLAFLLVYPVSNAR